MPGACFQSFGANDSMTRSLSTVLLVLAAAAHADPASMSEMFSQGTMFGSSNNAAIQGNIVSGAAQSALPSATANVPQASYFGSAGLSAPAAGTISACAAGGLNPNSYGDQACQAVNFSQTNPTAHPPFNLQPTDPIFAKTKAVLNDPAAIAGNITGTYSGCTTQSVTSPDIFTTQVCNAYRALEQPTCSKTLTVTVADNGLNCGYGAWLTGLPRIAYIRPATFVGAVCAEDIRFSWFYTFSECDGTDDYQYVTTVMPSEDFQIIGVNLGCGGYYNLWGSCLNGNCSYDVGSVSDNYVCDQYDYSNPSCDDSGCTYPCLTGHDETVYNAIATLAWQRPVHTYTITDAWDDQCAPYEARLP